MIFSSLIFIFAFLPIILGVYFLLQKKYRKYWLLLSSIFLYAWSEPKYLFLLILSIFINYIFGLLIEKFNNENRFDERWSKFFLIVSICFNIALIFVYKYLNFFTKNLNYIFDDSINLTNIALPVGISFFTFSALSYLIDIYKKRIKAEKNLFIVGLYISLFPKLTVGPIVKFDSVVTSIKNSTSNFKDFSEGVKRFIFGLSKNVILASIFKIITDRAFGMTGSSSLSVSFAWLGAIAYTFQLYFDFSGYCDMAIGVGLMLGFKFNENFNFPYISKSVSEFWRRWHITLGIWFKDYVYIPLGGSRVGKFRLVLNLLFVWMLTGFWHGASWSFVIWGFMHFILITFEKLSGLPNIFRNNWQKNIYRVFVLLFILMSWVLFRSNGFMPAYKYFMSMFGLMNNKIFDDLTMLYLSEYWIYFMFAFILSIPIFNWIKSNFKLVIKTENLVNFLKVIIYVSLFLVSVSCLVVNGHNPPVYFNF